MLRHTSFLAAVAASGLTFATVGLAQTPPPAAASAHPHYSQALVDLRLARALLMVPDDTPAHKFELTAVNDIDQAMAEIKHASIDDGKSPDDHVPIDANVSHRDRLHEIQSLVEGVTRDLNADEDDKKALGWRARAIKDVADAHAFVLAAENNEKEKPKKP